MNTVRLLIFEPSYRAIESELTRYGSALTPLIMDAEGIVRKAGEIVDTGDDPPEAAWASGELYVSKASRAFIAAALGSPNLKWVQSAAAGFDHPMFSRIVEKGARLTTSHGQAVGMADYVLSGVLDHFQRGPERRAAQHERAWRSLPFREIKDSLWLIVGFGAIGQAVAERARAFGARIVGVRRDLSPHPLADRMVSLETAPSLLPEADVVVLSVPANARTRGLVDESFLASMKTGSVLVNVGRGALVDEPALLAALDRGVPAHAVLDVFAREPLPNDSPLWSHPRVSISAHNSGDTGGQHRRNQILFLENLERFLGGRPLIGEVEPDDVLDRRAQD